MKKIIPFLILFISCLSCKKEEIVVVIPSATTKDIQLNVDQSQPKGYFDKIIH